MFILYTPYTSNTAIVVLWLTIFWDTPNISRDEVDPVVSVSLIDVPVIFTLHLDEDTSNSEVIPLAVSYGKVEV